jgi:hypothetical protein
VSAQFYWCLGAGLLWIGLVVGLCALWHRCHKAHQVVRIPIEDELWTVEEILAYHVKAEDQHR